MMMVMMMKISSTWQAASFFMDSVVEVTASLRRAPWPWRSIIAILSWCGICFEKENKRKGWSKDSNRFIVCNIYNAIDYSPV